MKKEKGLTFSIQQVTTVVCWDMNLGGYYLAYRLDKREVLTPHCCIWTPQRSRHPLNADKTFFLYMLGLSFFFR